ncbi:hypothetical protein L3X38_019840 [Prunus dulcis]|uniref:Mitochondrial protein n=1 Tax=Prunus dulcis TaxID=3755 RepID=A0AAD4ZCF6_PRUDU|nr:hypothetical protein L3X38_019840 [Prunus dulcis]
MGDNSIVGVVAAASANLCVSDSIPGFSSNTWIIHTGASDHITYDTKFFDELSSNTCDPYITSTNGLPSPITGECTISLTPTLSFSSALLVPRSRDDWASVKDKEQIWLWYPSLFVYFKRLFPSLFRSCDESSFKCETCILAKSHRTVFPLSDSKAVKPFDFVHSDMWGPARVASNGFHWYYSPNDNPIYSSAECVSERKNRQLLEVAHSLMLEMYVPHHLWGHAVLCIAYLINRTPSQVLDFKTSHDVFGDHVSSVSVFKLPHKVFGCVAYVHVYSHQQNKLDYCALRYVFIGYSSTQKGHKCYHPPTQKVHVTLEVIFHEEVSYYVSPSSPIEGEKRSELESLRLRMKCLKILLSGRKRPVALKQVTGRLYLKIKLVVSAKKRLIALWNSTDRPYLEMKRVLSVSKQLITLKQLHNALSNLKWIDAMNIEIDALNKNKTWDLVPLPREKKVVGCRWVFTLKHKADGSIDNYKARLIAKGYTQTYGVDYLEIFTPVAKLNTVRVLLSLVANCD